MKWRPLDYLAVFLLLMAVGGTVFMFEIAIAESIFDYDLVEGWTN